MQLKNPYWIMKQLFSEKRIKRKFLFTICFIEKCGRRRRKSREILFEFVSECENCHNSISFVRPNEKYAHILEVKQDSVSL